MAMRIPFDPTYVDNGVKGTNVYNGNGEMKGFTAKYDSQDVWVPAVCSDEDEPLVLEGTYSSNNQAIYALLMHYACEVED